MPTKQVTSRSTRRKEKNSSSGRKSLKVVQRWVYFRWSFENVEAKKLRNRNTTGHGSREDEQEQMGVDCKGENSAGPSGCMSWR